MSQPILNKSEYRLYKKLTSHWNKFVAVYPQIPVKNVIGYKEIEQLPISKKASEYLKQTEFDFVVCELDTAKPILAIEFDGICGGFSHDGQYNLSVTPLNDPHRKLKLNTKLQACSLSNIPRLYCHLRNVNFLIRVGTC